LFAPPHPAPPFWQTSGWQRTPRHSVPVDAVHEPVPSLGGQGPGVGGHPGPRAGGWKGTRQTASANGKYNVQGAEALQGQARHAPVVAPEGCVAIKQGPGAVVAQREPMRKGRCSE